MNSEDVKQLAQNIAAGRGLWVGMFLPDHSEGRAQHPIADYLPLDAHLTLMHLGRHKGSIEMATHIAESVATACEAVYFSGINAELTGVGWFWRRSGKHTMVALVNSAQLLPLRTNLLGELRAVNGSPDDHFGFIPHITLAVTEGDAMPAVLADPKTYALKIKLPMLHLVCGEAKIEIPTKELAF